MSIPNPHCHAITACRVCGNQDLVTVLDLGLQALTGVFPHSSQEAVGEGPLELVVCHGAFPEVCGLVQLRHTYELSEMYGETYGYRSSLNRSMVEHLGKKVQQLLAINPVRAGDVVLDIGSNDGTSLGFYPADARLFGMDPSAKKWASLYKPHVRLLPEYFNAAAFLAATGGAKARIISSIAMFYDLEQPLAFMRDVHASLADDGIWHLEQSYLPRMLEQLSYDTVCHEHLEYYSLHTLRWMLERTGFRIVAVELNDINGGSFAVTVCKTEAAFASSPEVDALLAAERATGILTLAPYERFRDATLRHRDELRALIARYKADGKRVGGLAASTKGNVTLQFCGLTSDDLFAIGEVNSDKFGCVTPGTRIPIVSEAELFAQKPDLLLVLPWHFRATFLQRCGGYLKEGGKLLFPLPKIEVVSA